MERRIGVVGVRNTSARVGPQASPARAPHPRKIGVKKSRLKIPWRRFYPKSTVMAVFELAVGFNKFCRGRKNRVRSRALSPPRLATGAGDRNTETLKDFYVFGL